MISLRGSLSLMLCLAMLFTLGVTSVRSAEIGRKARAANATSRDQKQKNSRAKPVLNRKNGNTNKSSLGGTAMRTLKAESRVQERAAKKSARAAAAAARAKKSKAKRRQGTNSLTVGGFTPVGDGLIGGTGSTFAITPEGTLVPNPESKVGINATSTNPIVVDQIPQPSVVVPTNVALQFTTNDQTLFVPTLPNTIGSTSLQNVTGAGNVATTGFGCNGVANNILLWYPYQQTQLVANDPLVSGDPFYPLSPAGVNVKVVRLVPPVLAGTGDFNYGGVTQSTFVQIPNVYGGNANYGVNSLMGTNVDFKGFTNFNPTGMMNINPPCNSGPFSTAQTLPAIGTGAGFYPTSMNAPSISSPQMINGAGGGFLGGTGILR